ncbi:hypothetical protein Agub_g3302 [Astrephomene gubernaculifera]|uniref:Sulfotransferase n=1 Tax=Astrephomene gubernaculifera TaxID=47775 RepID=A0AAD3HJC3_9CHLO|nr:hypothetical protein Agub_g3302 [Astrephomene gubernaculifera]
MTTHVVHRRLTPHKQQKSQNSWAERCLSMLLIAASVALGCAVVSALLRTFQPFSASLPVVLQPKESQNAPGLSTQLVFKEPSPEEVSRLRKAAQVLDPELMEQIPEAFNSSVRNPCWTSPSGEFKCLPYFYVTGLFHAGGLTLGNMLREHPEVVVDACTGCQFWGEEGKKMGFYLDHMREAAKAIQAAPDTKVLMDGSASTFAFYWAGGGKAHRGFAEAMQPCYRSCVDSMHKDKVPVEECMDKKCYNMSLAADVQRAVSAGIDYDTEAHNPLLVRAVYGNRPPKMILVVRDPIPRLYSAFMGYPHYYGKYGKTSAGFTAYVKEQVGAFRTCAASYGERRCALLFEALGAREEKVYFHADQLMRGMYGLFLEIWYRFIPPTNWMVVHSDDFFSQPKDTLKRVIDFLGLKQVDDAALEKMRAAGKPNTYTTGQPPMEPEARKLLAELYTPYNSMLAKLTGDKRYEQWNQQPPAQQA